jgi:transitional endoplasmic reticulum ATPase
MNNVQIANYDPALNAIENGNHTIRITGNINDYVTEINSDNLYYIPLYLAEKLFQRGFFVVRYCRSNGLSIHRYSEIQKDKDYLDEVLRKSGINQTSNQCVSPDEVVEIFRGFIRIMSQKHKHPFLIIVDYAPHLSQDQNQTNEERIVAEAINEISNLPSVQKSGNIFIAYAHDDTTLSQLVKSSTYKVHYSFPDIEEYERFFRIMQKRHEEFSGAELPPNEMARLSKGLRLSDLARLFREYKKKNSQVSVEILNKEKSRIIEQISDGTLTVLPTHLGFEEIAGMEVPKRILANFGDKLKVLDPSSPRALLFTGPPGTGKSTLAVAFAKYCNFNIVELSDDIKSKWVGESESNLNKALDVIKSLSPVILFIDEIDQSFTNRSSASLDGGVSQHYLKTIFKFSGQEEHRGKICIIGCSNTPQLLDPAMINRFINIPILEPTPIQMAAIFPKIQARIMDKISLNPKNHILVEACKVLYNKGAMPRQFYEIISHAVNLYGENINEDHILECSNLFRCSGDLNNIAFSSLCSISMTSFSDYLPWSDNPSSFPYPWYLNGVVDEKGNVNDLELNNRIEEYRKRSKY